MTSCLFFDHSRHILWVSNVAAPLDVLAFNGQEQLSQPFTYRVEFTSPDLDLAAESMLGKPASFSLHAPPQTLPLLSVTPPKIKPLRVLHGVVTAFARQSGSNDQANLAWVLFLKIILRTEYPIAPRPLQTRRRLYVWAIITGSLNNPLLKLGSARNLKPLVQPRNLIPMARLEQIAGLY